MFWKCAAKLHRNISMYQILFNFGRKAEKVKLYWATVFLHFIRSNY